MNLLLPLAGLLGIEVEAITERVKRAVLLNAVMALFAAIGGIFLLVAAYVALADAVGPAYSGLIISGVFLLLALIVFAVMKSGENRHRREVVERKRSSDTTALMTTAALTALPVLLKSPVVRTIGLPAAAVAAFLLLRNGKNNDT